MNKYLAAVALGAFVTGLPSYAYADTISIQMLPPTPIGSSTTCPSNMQAILSYSGATQGQSGINCVPITTDAAGDMAAGGYVEIGTTGTVCTTALAGAMRFNPTTLAFEGCNGSSWQPIGNVPSGTICGMQTNGPNFGPLCEGYSPYNLSCPPGYSVNWWTVSFGNGEFMFCVKD